MRSLFFTDPLIILCTIVMGTVSLVISFFDRSGDLPHRVARVWSRLLLRVSGLRVRVEGIERLDRSRGCILVANHQSLMDIPLLVAYLPIQFRFFAKEGLFHIPFLGTHLRRTGHLPVVRDNPRAALRIVHDAARMIRERQLSVLLFPEGGRTPDTLREFKEGAAHLAIKAGVEVIPIGVVGTRAVLPMGSVHFHPRLVELRVGEPIPTAGLKLQDRATFTRRLEQKVAELVGEPVPVPADPQAFS
ncbi:MAG TPA: lysophospholipid acyltransferase family protein [Bryobacteraceae bacterium]|nr:lysophospholipid acyltransferase family protein [Bryobacteraceae bacterium]